MKKIKFTCTNCDAKLRVPTHLAGVSAPCPKCGATITAPSDITQAVEDDEPRRSVASNPAPAARGHQQEGSASPVVSHSPSATAIAEPPVLSSAPAAVTNQVAAAAAKANPVPVPSASPVPAAQPLPSLPKTTATVEIPTPASRPLQPRPLTPPAQVETPTAFFTPPPPVLPITPVAPEPDLRSEAPVSLPSSSPVVVEVTTLPVPAPAPPPPAAVITQPIQVNARPSDLPGVRSEVSGSDSLPRLDVSLAGQDLSAAAALLFGENSGQPVRTRVQLPQPGVETHKFSPDDFIVPPAAPRETAAASDPSALESYEPPALEGDGVEAGPPQYLNIPLPTETGPIPLDELGEDLPEIEGNGQLDYRAGEDDNYFTDLSDADEIPAGLEAPAWTEEELADEFVPAAPVEVPWNLQPSSVPEGVEFTESEVTLPAENSAPAIDFNAADRYDEVPVNPLHEGSFGKLFSQQSGVPLESAASSPGLSSPLSTEPDPGSPALRSAGILPTPIADHLDAPEGDVLDELFGGPVRNPGDARRLSKTAVVMISCLVGAAAIAVLMVVFLWQVLGGLDPAEAYKEGSIEETAEELAKGKAKSTTVVNEPALDDAPAIIDPVAVVRDPVAAGSTKEATSGESPALSIDERVQQIVNGTTPASGSTGGSVIGSPSLDLVDDAIDKFNSPAPAATEPLVPAPPAPELSPAPELAPANPVTPPALEDAPPAMLGPAGQESADPAARSLTGPAAKSTNYNPPASFAAPGPNDSPLLRTNDVIDAFLRAPDWQSRVKYTYQGDSLQPAVEDYYKKWPDNKIDRYSLQLFQMEQSAELGGPYWVYLVSTSDMEQGFPLIIRVEEGNLKIDWEIYSEFYDRHFVRFREGTMPRPATFRVVIERVSDYYGSDREAFTNVKDYYVYQINPPYGDLNEFSEYAFVKKDSELAKKLEGVVGLGDEPLAVIVTLDEKPFEHGVKHFVITEYVTEGWFR